MKKLYIAITTAMIVFGSAVQVLADTTHWG